ncbi:nucleolar protein 58-like isoform X1 [Montipora capricornis]|uniref:nucleolar protein 58-like isoform X1 n=1 Tax=Montipora capricornis TaxID=246305 RepID=UPI0035F19907
MVIALHRQDDSMAAETEPEGGTVAKTETSSLHFGKVLNRLYEVPVVNTVCKRVSGAYRCTRDSIKPIQFGFRAAEVTVKTAMVTTQRVYSALPTTGLLGHLKDGFETKVSQVDNMACNGIDFMQKKWPAVQESKDQILALGVDKLEQSDVAEVLLTVTEAAVDFCKPTPAKREYKANNSAHDQPVVVTKIDRIRGVNKNIMAGGAKVVSFVISVPSSGVNAAKNAAQWSWNFTRDMLQSLPIIGQKKDEPRRSKRQLKGNYRRMVNEADPFASSPDRKRKYEQGESEGTLTEQLVYVSDSYVSDEDPDFHPDDDEDSEASTEDEEDSGNEDDENSAEKHQSELKRSKNEQKSTTLNSTSQDKNQPTYAKVLDGPEKEQQAKQKKEEPVKNKEEPVKTKKEGENTEPNKEGSKPKKGEEVKPKKEEETKKKTSGEESKTSKREDAKASKGQHVKEDYAAVKSLLNLKLY